MNVNRLMRLAALLDQIQVDGRQFAMDTWGYQNDCGTVTCAMGWAAQDPTFQAEGLSSYAPKYFEPVFDNKDGIEAAAAFFGLHCSEAGNLFFPEEYPGPEHAITPSDVAKRVRRLLERAA